VKSKEKRKIVLKISPMTHVRATQNDRWFFRIKRSDLRPAGLKRLERLEKYNEYKIGLSAEAKRNNFTPCEIGMGITFFIPVPKSWSQKKKKLHHGQFHNAKPDIDNILKSFFDSLLSEDKKICHLTHISKRWVNHEQGWIEVVLTDPKSVFIAPPEESRLL
jgi:Holliday junction resolvase RusA-like endonuclease